MRSPVSLVGEPCEDVSWLQSSLTGITKMRRRELEMMAGMRRSRQERVTDRQIQKFRRQQAEHEQTMLLIDKIRERERGTEGFRPMPFAGSKK